MSDPIAVDLEARIPAIRSLRPQLLHIARTHGTPCYVFDVQEARRNLSRYHQAFSAHGLPVRIFYAIKSNPYPGLLKSICEAGDDLDASSDRELALALEAGARQIMYTGPGKGPEDFALILKHHRKVTVHLDSVTQLKSLGRATRRSKHPIRCGLRITSGQQRQWNKFGVPLEDLGEIWRMSKRYPQLHLCGLQFHSGTLTSPAVVTHTLKAAGQTLRAQLSPADRARLEFIDIGGGIVPEAFEGIYPWNRDQVMRFDHQAGIRARILQDRIRPHYLANLVHPVETFGREIAAAFCRHILPINPAIALYTEPGKYISHSVMHFLFRVIDVKGGGSAVIVDAGGHMVGWEKYEYFDYVPIFNLSRFSPAAERPVLVYGNLCTPHDLFGYYLRTSTQRLQLGDVLGMPYQGAYTYTLAQNFIRNIPPVVDLTPAPGASSLKLARL